MSRKLFGVTGDGLKLKGDHRYRVVGEYDNPTEETRVRAMAHMSGLFAPDDMGDWPKIDPASRYQRDLVSLQVAGPGMTRGSSGHEQMRRRRTQTIGGDLGSLQVNREHGGRHALRLAPQSSTILRTPTHLVYHHRP